MSDNMREAFEKWAVSEGMPITRGHYYDVYASAETRAAYLAWQAAQSVPVVGEPVAYACPFHAGEAVVNGTPCMLVCERNVNDYAKERGFPLVVKPTHSITADELERLRKCEKDAESYRRLVAAAKAEADTHCTYPDCICPDGVSMGVCNLGLPDAAIAGEQQ